MLLPSKPTFLAVILASGALSQPLKRDDASSDQANKQIASEDSYTIVKNGTGVWPYRRYKTTDAISPQFVVEQTGEQLAEGSIFITLADLTSAAGGPQGAYIMSPEGDLIWSGPSPDTSNFRTQQYNNEPVISTWVGMGSAAAGGGASHGYGQVNVYNSKYEVVETVCPSATQLAISFPPGSNSSCVADVHESYITESNTMLVTVYNQSQADLTSVGGPKNGYIVSPLAVEVDIATNEPLWIWNPQDHVPFSASNEPIAGEGNNASNAWDWFHMNSIQSFNGGYLINSRQTWTSYFVNKQGDIEWEINGKTGGSFGSLPAGYNFSWEHHARLHKYGQDDSKVLYTCFNDYNGDFSTHNPSSGIGFILDTTKGSYSIQPWSNLVDQKEKLSALAEGSYQLLNNGSAFVGYGVFPVMKEFGLNSKNGSDVRYTAQFAYNNYTASSYRSFKEVWHATPSADIDFVATNGTGYVSWNGATDVTSYGIYTQSHQQGEWYDSGYYLAKKGFETAFQIPRSLSSIQIVALVGSSVVGRSKGVVV